MHILCDFDGGRIQSIVMKIRSRMKAKKGKKKRDADKERLKPRKRSG